MSITTDTKNALGVGDSTRKIIFKRVNEKIQIEENTSIIEQETYGNSFMLDSPLNGILGINENTQNSIQTVLGSTNRESTIYAVININNRYREHFKDTDFCDTNVTTADWGTGTAGLLSFTPGEIAQSLTIAKDGNTYTQAIILYTLESGSSDDLSIQLCATGTANFENVTLENNHNFTNTGTDLRFKIIATGTASINLLKIIYG